MASPRHCERSEAIHSAACREMDCFVACAPLRKRPTFVAGNDGGKHVASKQRKWGRKPMIPPLKPGAKLLKVEGPVIETVRLILRPWRSDDIAANTAMLS